MQAFLEAFLAAGALLQLPVLKAAAVADVEAFQEFAMVDRDGLFQVSSAELLFELLQVEPDFGIRANGGVLAGDLEIVPDVLPQTGQHGA